MKKVSLLFMALLASMTTRAYDAQINGIYYNLNNSSRTAAVTSPSSNSSAYSGEVEIPESVTNGSTTYNVTAIGDYAFKDCTALTGVVIPSAVTSFGEDTFYGCTGLEYVIALIETPFEIPQHTFYYNSKSEGIKPLSHLLFVLGDAWSWKWNNWGSSPKSDGNTFSADVDGIETKFDVISVKDRTCKLYDGFGAIPKTVAGVYTIPERTCGLTVTGIGYGAFMDCAQLTGIIIPNTVTDIDIIPFMNCTSLTSITIPSSVKSIKGATFKLTNITEVKVDEANGVYDSRDNCNAIIETSTNILVAGCKASTIPNTVTAIADMAFEGTGIAAIDIPEQVTSIGASAFRYCDKLVSVTVEMRVPVVITEDAFTNRANATLHVPYGSKAAYEAADYWKEFKEIVEMPYVSPIIEFADANVKALCIANWDTDGDGKLSEDEAAAVTDLGDVFKGNTTITSFNELSYFNGLESISRSAFSGCSSLASVVIPNRVTTIAKYAFYQCSSLASVILGNNVETIGENAFCECRSLTTVTMLAGLKSLDWGAFAYCSGLTVIAIPSSVSSIHYSAFIACSSLTTLTVENGNTVYDSRGNCNAIIETATNSLAHGCKYTVIPNDVTALGYSAFDGCSGLTAIVIPASVTSIGDFAFSGCSSLTSVTVENDTPVSIGSSSFSNRANAKLYVPAGSKAAYEGTDYWKDFKEIVEMPYVSPIIEFADANVKALCIANWDTNDDGELSEAEAAAVWDLGDVFRDNQTITSFDELQYFTNLTSIIDNAFCGCSCLTSIIIPNKVTSIGNGAFSECRHLTSINIPNSVKYIGDYAFEYNAMATSITIPNGVVSIGSFAFSNCRNLTSVTVPSSVTAIGEGIVAFSSGIISLQVESGNAVYDSRNNCNGIIETASNTIIAGCKNTIIPDNVANIADYAFEGCNVTSMFIPNTVISIGNAAFSGCSDMTSVTFPNNLTNIGTNAFWGCSSLASVMIPASLNDIGAFAFYGCDHLTSVTVMAKTPLLLSKDVFSNCANAILYVPAGSKEAYAAADYWKEFKEIVEMEPEIVEKCAAPTIAYNRGELVVESETEGAECHVTIATADAGEQTGGRITLKPTYTITAWATAEGFAESDRVTATLTWCDSGLQAEGMTIVATKSEAADVNNDGIVNVADISTIISVMASKAQ